MKKVKGCEVWSEEGECMVMLKDVSSNVSEEWLRGEYRRLMDNELYSDIMGDMVGEGEKVKEGELLEDGMGYSEFNIGEYVGYIKCDIERLVG